MEISIRFGVLFTFLTSLHAFGQIEIGGEQKPIDPVEAPAPPKEKKENTGTTQIYFNINQSSSFRTLESNGDLFGDTLGIRSDEFRKGFASFGFGYRAQLNGFIQLSAGLEFMRNGEQFVYEQTDSLYQYVNTYRYLAMPIGLNFVCGQKDIRFVAGLGVAPGMFISYTQDQEWRTQQNTPGKNQVKVRAGSSDFNNYVFSAYAQAGVEIKFGVNTSIYLMPSYRTQLVSSFDSKNDFIHKAYTFGANFGLVYQL